LGAQSPHQTGQVILPEANVNAPGTFHGSERDSINRSAFFKQSFEFKIKGDLIPEATAEELIGELQTLFARHIAGLPSARRQFSSRPRNSTQRATEIFLNWEC